MKQVRHQKSLYIIYSILSISILNFLIINNTYADENLDYSVTVEPALNITTSAEKVSLDLNPLNHNFDSQDLTVSVSTNNETGYKLYINASDNKLIEKDDNNLYIETLVDEVSESNFTTNRWGYKLNSGNYLPFVPGTLINQSKTAIENNASTLTFAAKIDYGTKAGSYNLALNFQATANPLTKTIANAEYMQEVDSKEIGGCPSDLTVGEVYHLKDSRDQKTYYVARLADGNCWMLDNLAVDVVSLSVDDMKDKTNATESDLNYLKGVTKGTTSDQYATSGVVESLVGSYSVPQIGSAVADGTGDASAQWGNGQHKYGILYNYCAVSAGTYCYGNGGSSAGSPSGNATADICPAGWRLPTGGTSGEIQQLCNAVNGSNCITTYYGEQSMAATNVNSLQYQLSLSLSGNWIGGRYQQGETAYIISSTYYDAGQINAVQIYPSKILPNRPVGRGNGHPVRCLLK